MSTPNYCLIEKLRVTFGLEIPELSRPGTGCLGHRPGRPPSTQSAVR